MKTLVFAVLLVTVAAVQAGFDPGLRVHFGYGNGVGSSFFYDLKMNKAEAQSIGWKKYDRPAGQPMPQLELYCYSDCIACLLFDDINSTVGVQVAIQDSLYTDAIYSWEDQGFTNWTVNINGTATNMRAITIYFTSEEILSRSQEERLADRMNSNETLLYGFVQATGFDKNLTYIYKNATEMINNNTIFTKQGCVPWMGTHYYYNMSSTTECSSTSLYPWFPLERCGQMIALGLATYGKITVPTGQRTWFENPPLSFVEKSVPNAPQCVYDNAISPGITTIHINFIDQPWLISCFDLLDCYL